MIVFGSILSICLSVGLTCSLFMYWEQFLIIVIWMPVFGIIIVRIGFFVRKVFVREACLSLIVNPWASGFIGLLSLFESRLVSSDLITVFLNFMSVSWFRADLNFLSSQLITPFVVWSPSSFALIALIHSNLSLNKQSIFNSFPY